MTSAQLDGPRFWPAAGGRPRQLVLLLHGVGADGHDLIDLAPHWAKAVPEALFIAPHAPFPYDQAPPGFPGRQWFSLADRSPARMEAGVREAADALERVLRPELLRLGLSLADTALMGFSQGAMTALYAGLRLTPAPAAILAFSGALLGAARPNEGFVGGAPVLLVHGIVDEVVPVAASQGAEAALRAAGVAVQCLYPEGLGHGIDELGMAAGAEFLQRAFDGGVA